MITTETYVKIDPHTSVAYHVDPPDGEARVVIGPSTGTESALILCIGDPDTFRRLAQMTMNARDEYVRQVLERRPSTSGDQMLSVVR